MRALNAWRGGLLMTEGQIGVLSVSSLILTRVGVHVGVCVHCTYKVLGCEPRGRDKIPGGPEESRWTKYRHIRIHLRVQSTYVYVYARRRDEFLD